MSTLIIERENIAIHQARRRRAGETIAGSITLEITHHCNLRCLHCYLEPYTYGKESQQSELSTSEVKDILEQLFDAGAFLVDFTGGEPLCRKDIFEIMEYARKIGLFFGIKTNATLVTDSVADKFKELGIGGVNVSIYGSTAATHEYVTGVPGSFETTIGAVKLLRERNIRVKMNTTMMKYNVREHMEIEKLGKELGVSNSFDPFLLSKVGHPGSAAGIRMDDDDLKALIFGRNWIPDEKYLATTGLEPHLLCSAARSRCAISPQGEVFPCTSWRIPLGDLRKQSFSNIWQGTAARKIRSMQINDLPVCSKCELAKYCARCPGLVSMEKEDSGISGPSSVNCRMARAIKEVIDAKGKESLR